MKREKKYFSFSFFVLMLITFLNITKLHAQLTLNGPATAHYGDILPYALSEDSSSEFWDFSWGADGTVLTDQDGHQTQVEVYWDGNPGNGHLVYVFYKSKFYWDDSYYEELAVDVSSDPSDPAIPYVASTTCNEVVLQRTDPPGNARVNHEDITWYWQSTPTGTSTANSNPTITLTSGNEYYLRAKTNSGYNTWSAGYSSVQYQIESVAPIVGNVIQPSITNPTGSVSLSGLPSDNWTINPGNISGSGTTTTITGLAAATTYNFTVTNSTGCTSLPSANVVIGAQAIVLETPTFGAVTQPNCSSDTGNFNINNYNPSYTYVANPSAGVSFSGATVKAPEGSYTITATSGQNSSYPSAAIVVNAVPAICRLSNENYVHTIVPTTETTDADILPGNQRQESVTYLDGVGRPKQSIGIRAGGNSEDIITHVPYDDFGRQELDYLPYSETSNDGFFRTGDITLATKNFYNTTKYENTTNPYSQKAFEPSPLNRILKQAAPGEDWKMGNGHEIKYEYQINADGDQVRNFGVSFVSGNIENPKLEDQGVYAISQLYKTITKDENWQASQTDSNEHTTQEFKDKEGRVVLKRTFGTVESGIVNEKYDTYYVYDEYGNLTFVIPPKAANLAVGSSTNILANETSTAKINSLSPPLNITATNSIRLLDGFTAEAGSTFSAKIVEDGNSALNELCYQYRYDNRKRLVEKKLPGKDWEYIIYDKLDRPVLAQDAGLRAEKKWIFTKYDAFNRQVYTGKYFNNIKLTRVDVQALVYGTVLSESKQAIPQSILGTSVNYTNLVFPNSDIDLLTINYYDDYLNIELYNGTAANAVSYNVTPITNAKGLTTCSKIRVLDTDNWITNVVYYDNKSRLVYNYSKNTFLNIESTVKNQLDFTGKVLETTSTHQKGNTGVITIIDTYTFNPAGRMLTQKQKINTQNPEIIVSNTYDSLGQLSSKGVGGKMNQSRLQTVDFTYNIRGWLKGINDSDNNTAAITMGAGDLFGFQINYNNPSTGNAFYNGNISQTFWKTANTDTSLKNYNYNYDALNRLLDATDNLGKFTETLRYDKNGNITYLKRLGEVVGGNTVPDINIGTHFGTMDELTYTYDSGNKLMKVADAAPVDEFGFKDDALNLTSDTQDDYKYDANGNMTVDTNKGITDIKYNYFNLPEKIVFNTGTVEYKYDAAGMKQQKIVNGITTDYASGFIYENNILKFLSQPEGYVTNNSDTYDYIYQYKDHLGNVRLSYGDMNNNGTITIVEENNYYAFGLKQKRYNAGTIIGKGNATAQKYKYNGKELQDELGLNMYDYGSRLYDPARAGWSNIDPLAEKMRRHSPYNYCFDNPMRFTDPDGMSPSDVIIKGPGADKTLAQLQKSTSLTLTMNDKGKVTATGEAKTKADKELKAATTDKNVTVNLNSTLGPQIADGSGDYLSSSGSFDGSTVNADGTATANQTVNPDYAKAVDEFEGTPEGTGVLHETLEGYQEGKRAQETQTPSGPAIPGTDGYKNYDAAHNKADAIDPRHVRTADSFTGTNPKTGEQARVLQKPNGQTMVLYKLPKK